MPHILYSQGRVLVLCVDPDNTMAQATHGKDSTGREGCTWDPRSAGGDGLIKKSMFPWIYTTHPSITLHVMKYIIKYK